ncbi:hypothetical protein PAXINDRAFT_18855 [Paxillus involutus ATCC 200175]|uniref:Uncharacterized protein n=1 Tax=Paxillus involutus ATCC 200175 TaxID=664439 RepID=A0A0C9SXY8_PAXIN|nr:hypothetical protein PAXINDRAFT_18855 [Paxillus involutus ATCC 200175]
MSANSHKCAAANHVSVINVDMDSDHANDEGDNNNKTQPLPLVFSFLAGRQDELLGEAATDEDIDNADNVVEWSRGGVESRDRGSREAVDEDGKDDVHHAHVEPQQPQTVSQTADIEATDTTNPNTTSVGPATPMGRSYGLLNASNEGEEGGEEDEKGEWASGIETPSSNDDGGDEDVRHMYVVPTSTLPPPYHALPTPDERRRPPSMLLKGEMTGQQSSGHNNETATHLEYPQQESSTPQPRRTPEKARDEARDDEEGQQNRERGQTTEERQTAATNANDEDDAPPPQPPSPPTPPALPPHPEQHDNVDHTKSNKMPA